jgi:hypothetical protein
MTRRALPEALLAVLRTAVASVLVSGALVLSQQPVFALGS